MKRITILVLLSLCVLSVRAQNRFRAAVIEPAAPAAETGLVRHPWTGKKVLFIGDSISDCVASHIVDRHYYDWLSDWLGITAYVPAISGWQMKDVEAEVRMFQATAPSVQPDMICIFLGTNDYNSGILDFGARIDFDWTPTPSHLVKFGAEYTRHDFIPEALTYKLNAQTDELEGLLKAGKHFLGNDTSLYAEDNISLGRHFFLTPGLHVTWFNTQGQNYFSLQPRMSAKATLDNGLSFKAGYSRMAQYVHLLSSSILSLPLDLWVPITSKIPPVVGDHYSIGTYYDGLPGWEFSLEGYWKEMGNLMEFKEGVSVLVDSSGWESMVEAGRGRSYGLELFAQKTRGKTTGWISYTLSRSIRWFDGGTINMGRPFLYKYVRTHTFNLTLNHKFSEKVDVSLSWIFSSGNMMTLPTRMTAVLEPRYFEDSYPRPGYCVSERNNYRLPPSHRLNLGVNLRHRTRRGNEAVWNFSIYNAYNAMNPHFVLPDRYNDSIEMDDHSLPLVKLTILPILPAFSYTYNF